MNLDATRFLQDVSGRYARLYSAAVSDLFVAHVTDNRAAASDARASLADAIVQTMGVCEVLGASIMLRDAAKLLVPAALAADRVAMVRFAAGADDENRPRGVTPDDVPWIANEPRKTAGEPTQTILPRVKLSEAIQDLVDRAPVTIRNAAERTALRISKIYSQGANMAFVKSAEATVTKTAQDFIQRMFAEGVPTGTAGKRLAMAVEEVRKKSEPWSEAYARTAFRTNVGTGVTAGRFRMAQDPDIVQVVPAFRFDAVGDSDTRDNHEAADGIILSVDNPAWGRIAPPLGYNCRCQVSHVTRYELQQAGRIDRHGKVVESRIPAEAFPDQGFRHGGRPDLFLGGA